MIWERITTCAVKVELIPYFDDSKIKIQSGVIGLSEKILS